MHVNYGTTVGLEIHKNWNNFKWKKESLVEDSLQKGKIISFPFLNGYTDVRCMVGGNQCTKITIL
jgi:hypothetical protein